MSLIFVDGFDHYQSLYQKWDVVTVTATNGNTAPTFVPGANSGYAIKFSGSAGASITDAVSKNFSNLATVFCGFRVWIDPASTTGDQVLVAFLDGATVQVDLRITTAGHLYFTRNGTVIGSQSSSALTFRAWHYLEVQVTINNTTGAAQLNVDSSNTGWLNLTAQNTRASANNQTGQVRMGISGVPSGSGFFTAIFDDFYLANTSGSFNTSFLGDVKITGLLPTGNGTSSQYTQTEASWAASTVTYIGRQIKDSNGNIQVVTSVTGDAKTAGSAPTWATSIGITTTDNHVTWICLGISSQWLDVSQNPPEGSGYRLPSTAYSVGTAIWDSNNNLQMCTTAGTSSSTVPTSGIAWNATVGGTTADGSVTWTNMGLGEDTYLSDATVGHISRFTFPAIVASSIKGVSVTMRARKDDASVRSIRGCALSGGTTGDNGADLTMSTSYQMVQGILESDPNTGSAWTVSAANAAEFGVKTIA